MPEVVAESAAPPQPAEIRGRVVELFCQELARTGRKGFCAGLMSHDSRYVKFRTNSFVTAGETVTLRGQWVEHPKFGRQFDGVAIRTMPVDLDGLQGWLAENGNGIGPVKAAKLVSRYGMELLTAWHDDPAGVAAFTGVTPAEIVAMADRWVKDAAKAAAQTRLLAAGLTPAEADAVMAAFGTDAPAVLDADPYAVLGRVAGFGWKKADDLAARLGVIGEDPRRLRGAVTSVAMDRYDQGDTCCAYRAACVMAAEKLGMSEADAHRVEATVAQAVAAKSLVLVQAGPDRKWLATPAAHHHERILWDKIAAAGRPDPVGYETALAMVESGYREFGGKTLDEGQIRAVATAVSSRVSVVTGGAGYGKTLIASVIRKYFADGDTDVMLAAPTGKAARRLEEVIGHDAYTIHRLLGYRGDHGFEHTRRNPLPPGVLIVDEVSMVDSALASHLFDAIDLTQTRVVLIGDPNQLPPVGPGAVLRDLLANDLCPAVRLEHCHRQAGTLKANCGRLLRGVIEQSAFDEGPPAPWVYSTHGVTPAKVVADLERMHTTVLREWGFDPVWDTQVMTAKHKGPLGTERINRLLQRLHQRTLGVEVPVPPEGDEEAGRPEVLKGDKVIQTINNYTSGVMNGTIGKVVDVERGSKVIVVEFPGVQGLVGYGKGSDGELSLAYCLSVHRMQGSEVPCAVVLVPSAHRFMHNRNWIYTGATRARQTAIVLSDPEGGRRAVEKFQLDTRQTLLAVWAQNEEARP